MKPINPTVAVPVLVVLLLVSLAGNALLWYSNNARAALMMVLDHHTRSVLDKRVLFTSKAYVTLGQERFVIWYGAPRDPMAGDDQRAYVFDKAGNEMFNFSIENPDGRRLMDLLKPAANEETPQMDAATK